MHYHLPQLPIEIRKQVEDYIEFLMKKYITKTSSTNPRLYAFGLYEGKISISDDFDDPLEDFKDYM